MKTKENLLQHLILDSCRTVSIKYKEHLIIWEDGLYFLGALKGTLIYFSFYAPAWDVCGNCRSL
jgi:hypothetical protein